MADSRTKKGAYLDSLKENLTGVSPQNNTEGGETGEHVDYYQNLKDEAYRSMLDSEVQAHAAAEQARKYTGTALASKGYGTQGLAESAQLGINNTLQNSLRESQKEYDQSLLSINQQEQQGLNDDFESLTTLMSQATTTEQLKDIMTTFGYWDEKTDTWNEKALAQLDKRTANQLKSIYMLNHSQFENNEFLSDYTINGVGYKDSGTAIQNIAAADGSTGSVSNELRKIFGDSYISKVEKAIQEDGGNYVVKLVNGSNDNKYVYMIYRNGAWYQTTANVFNGAKHKEVLKGEK